LPSYFDDPRFRSNGIGSPEPLGIGARLGDLAAAPFRGVEGAVQGLYGLADFATFDALPDYDERFLGRSKTFVGSAGEGITQFLAGFGAVGVAAKAAGVGGKLIGARGVAQSALTDFTFFRGDEERLSDMLQSVPALQNPVSAYLASSEDDGELEGRIKNVLEGLGLDAAFAGVIGGLRAIRGGATTAEAAAKFKAPRAVQETLDKLRRDRGDLAPDLDLVEDFFARTAGISEELRVEFSGDTRRSSNYDFAKRVVEINDDALQQGKLSRTMIHEVYHSLQERVTPEVRAQLTEQFQAARKAAMDQDPSLASRLETENLSKAEYRFLNEDEWFAELATERILPQLGPLGANKVVQAGHRLVSGMLETFRRRYKFDAVDEAIQNFRESGTDAQVRSFTGQVVANEAPDVRAQRVADLTKNFEAARAYGVSDADLAAPDHPLRQNIREILDTPQQDILATRRAIEIQARSEIPGPASVSLAEQTERAKASARFLYGSEDFTQTATYRKAILAGRDQAQAVNEAANHMLVTRMVLNEGTDKLKSILNGQGLEELGQSARDEFATRVADLVELDASLRELKGSFGRGLGALRTKSIEIAPVDAVAREANLEKIAKIVNNAEPGSNIFDALGDIMDESWGQAFATIATSAWMNSILSGLRTFSVNFGSGIGTTVIRPAEKILGSAFLAARGERADALLALKQGAGELYAVGASFREAARFALKSFRDRQNFAIPKSRVDVNGVTEGITAERMARLLGKRAVQALKDNPTHPVAFFADKLARGLELSGTALAATDEFWKQLNARMVLRQEASVAAKELGLDGAAIPDFLEAYMQRGIKEGVVQTQGKLLEEGISRGYQAGIRDPQALREYSSAYVEGLTQKFPGIDSVGDRAVRAAEESTFTQKGEAGLTSTNIKSAANDLTRKFPAFRFVVPFVNTPTNILGFAAQRSPLGIGWAMARDTAEYVKQSRLLPEMRQTAGLKTQLSRDLLSADAGVRAQAFGSLATAAGVLTTTVMLVRCGPIRCCVRPGQDAPLFPAVRRLPGPLVARPGNAIGPRLHRGRPVHARDPHLC
jgi:hypothetical protein